MANVSGKCGWQFGTAFEPLIRMKQMPPLAGLIAFRISVVFQIWNSTKDMHIIMRYSAVGFTMRRNCTPWFTYAHTKCTQFNMPFQLWIRNTYMEWQDPGRTLRCRGLYKRTIYQRTFFISSWNCAIGSVTVWSSIYMLYGLQNDAMMSTFQDFKSIQIC